MPTLTEEIEKIVYHSGDVTKLMSLIQSTVKGCVPVKTIKSSSDTSSYDIGWVAGRNQAIDTITANLKEKEVL